MYTDIETCCLFNKSAKMDKKTVMDFFIFGIQNKNFNRTKNCSPC